MTGISLDSTGTYNNSVGLHSVPKGRTLSYLLDAAFFLRRHRGQRQVGANSCQEELRLSRFLCVAYKACAENAVESGLPIEVWIVW